MRIKKQKKALALLRDKYQQDRGRGAVITIGHVEYGTLPEDIPAKVKMEDGYALDEAELAKLVAYLQLQARATSAAGPAPQKAPAPASPADASCARGSPAAVAQVPDHSTAGLAFRIKDCVSAGRAAASRARRALRAWYVRVREALQLWRWQATRR